MRTRYKVTLQLKAKDKIVDVATKTYTDDSEITQPIPDDLIPLLIHDIMKKGDTKDAKI